MGIIIKSIEYYLPDSIITNEDLQKENPQWNMNNVIRKSGVIQRHIAKDRETALDLSQKACDKLFNKKGNNKGDIDGIIYCTQSPDYIMPANSFLLHKYLDLSNNVFAYDFNHACTGYIYGLSMAYAFIKSGIAKQILLVNSETYSKYINSRDRSTRVLFGDGAAVSIVKKTTDNRGIIDLKLASSGKNYDLFYIPAGGMKLPKSSETSKENKDEIGNIRSKENIYMDGMKVWAFINYSVPKQINKILKRNNIDKSDIDIFIFHQASQMTIETLIRILKLDREKVFINIYNIGNTVSASIPIAIKDAISQGKIKRGQKVLLSGFGVGMSYGTILMEF